MNVRPLLTIESRAALIVGVATVLAGSLIVLLVEAVVPQGPQRGGTPLWSIGLAVGVVLAVLCAVGVSVARRLTRGLRERVSAAEHLALHDGMTNLPNRLLFQDRTAHAIRTARRGGGKLAVMLLDLDGFKKINDTLGHEQGDRLLIELSERLSRSLRESDTIARLGGDEFGLVIAVLDAGDAQRVARRLLGKLDEPVKVGDLSLRVHGSIGIALYPDDGDDTDTLVRKADVAMYAGKHVHLPVLYSSEHDHYSPDRLLLIQELRHALERDELRLHYQPIVEISTGQVDRLEALVRWQHPKRGLISPAEFVAFAEQTGMIESLTETVLRLALAQCSAWRRDGHQIVVAVNISGRDLGDRTFPKRITRLLAGANLDPDTIELEIDEATILADPTRTLALIGELRQVGVRLAVDNFGAGHTSLHYLRKLQADTLKIDRSFLAELDTDPDAQTIVRSTIELAHGLGLEVVAEGIETETTLAQLEALNCDLAQGHLFSKALPPDQLDLTGAAHPRSTNHEPLAAPNRDATG
jgi:diguanylate cyclase (GGDEF)-like protein